MLNLTRRIGETIMVGDYPITVVSMSENFIKVIAEESKSLKTIKLAKDEMVEVKPSVFMTFRGFQRKGQAKIGTHAPKHIAIHRLEIYRKINQEKAA